ncbi:hypothetical protein E2C01_060050 [Portunus trituberculatus]|uniref:Uncharacterized protein n=1 Tax=Portunus trituberculatus TaxID=210409 RepID=A0A5B7H484_PORTR|nr:hypothetical protein [Portunus trituberculatus]
MTTTPPLRSTPLSPSPLLLHRSHLPNPAPQPDTPAPPHPTPRSRQLISLPLPILSYPSLPP